MWKRTLCDWCNKMIEASHQRIELDHHVFHVKPTDCAEAYREYCREKVKRANQKDRPN